MAGIREQFYSALGAEFRDGARDSFLYRYLKQEKDASVREKPPGGPPRKREDAYVRLQERFLALERGEIGETDYWREFFALLVRNDRLHLDSGQRQRIWRWAEEAGISLEGAKRNGQRYERILQVLEAGTAAPMGARRLAVLHEALLHCILMADAGTFLYDAGCPALGGPAPRRKKDRVMDMLEAYCAENGLALQGTSERGGSAGELTAEEKRQYEAFFQTLRAAPNRRVLVPLLLDPATGAGLYIIGKEYFRGTSLYHSIRGSCCYACLYWDDLVIERGQGVSFSCSAGEEDLRDLCGFPNLEEALRWYQRILQRDAAAIFRASNGPAPENCPPALRHCFEPRRAARPMVDPEELRRAKEELEADFHRGK